MIPFKNNPLLISLAKIETKSRPCPSKGRTMEFHISRQARLKYRFDHSLFQSTGNVLLPDFRAARLFARKMNEKRDVVNFPETAVKAGQINAMGLVDEILHYVVHLYRKQENPQVLQEALQTLEKSIGKEQLEKALLVFCREFPPRDVYLGNMTAEEYLQGKSEGVPRKQLLLEEMMMLWLSNLNPALNPFLELFDDSRLEKETAYPQIMQELHRFFDTQPPFGPDRQNLLDMLQTPVRAVPHSLSGQLEYIRKHWGLLLGKYLYRLLSSLDLIKEEEKIGLAGPGPARVYEFGEFEEEPERFSPDRDWMPRLVLMAKSTYVWLDQLSKQYGREITRLDQIPDEELDRLARWGFTGLWLIGLWQRSEASRKIKQLCGNPEAVASAYSLYDYEIARDLGGEDAFRNLKERAWQRGIRMCGDMVPNHMGIDSRWVMEHPDRFISLDYSPFPTYSFNGPNLSGNENIGIYIEDHYYDRSDAAVVFKRVDFRTGDTRYIYHGNDGTSMPWNDTAQLNYLNPETREAVIQAILDVARRFHIIRFDAAMTLTKKHYQRLWFPEPGSGGDIPSRAEHGLTREEFDRLMPREFWREVVDRVAQEVPDTLLLAEAFWLMEGYFVRTLGMHRVYNSAFMNMLKNEENANYRTSIKNVLEFNPEILKRFVNFMNNPDEETAVAQFGKGDKYFGVCMMMVTMPGLPMFGHGQVEGFAEKYGMEYRRAYWNETPDPELVRRHEREIFPLMKKRYLFAEVRDFYLYDFFTADGSVNENVFSYSNRFGEERALVVYNNKFDHAAGWIKTSVAFRDVYRQEGESGLRQVSLGEGLGLPDAEDHFVIFRDHISGLEFIRNCREIHRNGLYVELGAYKFQVFLDFRVVQDNAWQHYAHLSRYLNGRGVPDVDEALRETFLQPLLRPFKELVNAHRWRELLEKRIESPDKQVDVAYLSEVEQKMTELLQEVRNFTGGEGKVAEIAGKVRRELETLLQLPVLDQRVDCPGSRKYRQAVKMLKAHLQPRASWLVLLGWLLVHRLGEVARAEDAAETARTGMDEWLLGKILLDVLQELGLSEPEARRAVSMIRILVGQQEWWQTDAPKKHLPFRIMEKLLADPEVQGYLQVNRYHELLWFNKESFEELMGYLHTIAIINALLRERETPEVVCKDILARFDIIRRFLKAEEQSGYRVGKLLSGLK